MKTNTKRQTTVHTNGHGHQPTEDDAQQILIAFDKLPKNGSFLDWATIRKDHAEQYAKLLTWGSFAKVQGLITRLRRSGHMLPVATKASKRLAKHKATATATPAPAAPSLRYCPHCAFPIGSVIKAVNALHTVRQGGG